MGEVLDLGIKLESKHEKWKNKHQRFQDTTRESTSQLSQVGPAQPM